MNYGFGPGLTLEVAGYAAVGDERGVRRAFGSAVVWSAATLGLLGATLLGAAGIVGARGLLGPVAGRFPGDAGQIGLVVLTGFFFAQTLVGLVEAVQAGYQEQHVTNRWAALGNALAASGRLDRMWPVGQSLDRRVSPRDSRRTLGSAVRQRGLGVVWVRKAHVLPHRSDLPGRESLGRLATAGSFSLIAFSSFLNHQATLLIGSRVIGSGDIAVAAVGLNILTLCTGVVATLVAPLPGAVADAVTSGDVSWVRRGVQRAQALGMAYTVVVGVLLGLCGSTVIHIWLRGAVELTPLTLVLPAGVDRASTRGS